MSLFEKYLTYGDEICQEEKVTLYKFLLLTKGQTYKEDARQLLKEKSLERVIANGEIKYSLESRKVTYRSRKIGTQSLTHIIRELSVGLFSIRKTAKIAKFFAQAEVDVLCNYPLNKSENEPEEGFGYFVYPYYDLNYYSNGAGRAIGLIKKLQDKDDQLLRKLLAS